MLCTRRKNKEKWKCTATDMVERSLTGHVSMYRKKGSSLKPVSSKFFTWLQLDYTPQTTDKTARSLLHRDYFYFTIIIIAAVDHCFSIALLVEHFFLLFHLPKGCVFVWFVFPFLPISSFNWLFSLEIFDNKQRCLDFDTLHWIYIEGGNAFEMLMNRS